MVSPSISVGRLGVVHRVKRLQNTPSRCQLLVMCCTLGGIKHPTACRNLKSALTESLRPVNQPKLTCLRLTLSSLPPTGLPFCPLPEYTVIAIQRDGGAGEAKGDNQEQTHFHDSADSLAYAEHHLIKPRKLVFRVEVYQQQGCFGCWPSRSTLQQETPSRRSSRQVFCRFELTSTQHVVRCTPDTGELTSHHRCSRLQRCFYSSPLGSEALAHDVGPVHDEADCPLVDSHRWHHVWICLLSACVQKSTLSTVNTVSCEVSCSGLKNSQTPKGSTRIDTTVIVLD